MAPKIPIGRVLLEKRKISQDELSQAIDNQKANGGRLASNLMDLGLAAEEDLLSALSEQLGLPAVDLSRCIIPLRNLDLVPREIAESAMILPLKVEPDRVLLAMSDPSQQSVLDEVSFVTGKRVDAYVALEAKLKNVIREAYAVHERDSEIEFYRGARSESSGEAEDPDGFLAVVSQELPEPEISMAEGEELITIEISADDEIAIDEQEVEQGAATTVLVVDDEEDIVQLLEKALKSEGFRVVSASRGLEALQAVKQHRPSLVLLDAMLPEIHGFEICKKIKSSKRFGHIPVIMISAVYRGWRYAEDVKNTYGADDYFEKPFRIVPLLRRVRELLNAGPPSSAGDVNPEAAAEAYRRGVSLYKANKLDEAEQALRDACTLDPFSANVHYALANVMLAKNRIYDALREYEYTVELKPDLFAPLKNLAILYQKKGFRNKAVEMWERALRCSPKEKTRQEVREQLLKLL